MLWSALIYKSSALCIYHVDKCCVLGCCSTCNALKGPRGEVCLPVYACSSLLEKPRGFVLCCAAAPRCITPLLLLFRHLVLMYGVLVYKELVLVADICKLVCLVPAADERWRASGTARGSRRTTPQTGPLRRRSAASCLDRRTVRGLQTRMVLRHYNANQSTMLSISATHGAPQAA